MTPDRATPFPGGLTLIAGGKGGDPDTMLRVLRALVSRIGKSPRVAYIGAASGDDPRFFGWVAPAFQEAGAGEVVHVKTVGSAERNARALLRSANLVFVSGGDVEAGMNALGARRLVPLLRELHASGTPFCGISAGSIMMAQEWVRWRDPDDESTAERFDCLQLAGVRVDTHGEAEGWQELVALLNLCPTGTRGYGLRAGSAIEMSADNSVQVIAGEIDVYERQEGGTARAGVLAPARRASQ